MDIAVISDIHGNYVALQAVIDYCMTRGITRFIFLGDYVTDCPDPQKTLEKIYVLKQYFDCTFVRGNREEYLLNYRASGEKGWHKGSASGSLLYTYNNLTGKDLDFFDSMPIYTIWQERGATPMDVCHGSPEKAGELLFKDKRNTKRVLTHLKTDYLLHGHNHLQDSYIYRGKRSINPGSVGIPWFYDGKAQFAIIHSKGKAWEEELLQIDYDRDEILKDFQGTELVEMAPAWAAISMHTIRTGVDLNQTILLRAMRLCEEDNGSVTWPDIPEKYWAIALRENNIDLQGRDIPKKD